MPKGELPPKEKKPASEFKLDDLYAGEEDPRGRLVLDILWSVKEFRIYRTEQGISPFFSDDDDIGAVQKRSYLQLGEDIARFNHLLKMLPPQLLLRHFRGTDTMTATRVQFERELARCMAIAFLDQVDTAKTALASVLARLESIIANRARVIHIGVTSALVIIVWLILFSGRAGDSDWVSALSWSLELLFPGNGSFICLALAMGSLGALFSTAIGLKNMEIDAAVNVQMHFVYSSIRVLVGALAAFILYFGVKSGILDGLFRAVPASAEDKINIYWLCFVSIIAGFSERLVPNLLKARADQMTEANKAQSQTP